MKLTEHALSAAPLLEAIAAGGDLSNAALAAATGRSAKNMSRDLDRLADAGWLAREPGSPPALTAEGQEVLAALARASGEAGVEAAAVDLPLHLIDDNPENPRRAAIAEDDAELTASIGKDGVLQPIMVRPAAEPGRYVVIMGSRRRRCAIAAGKFTIPAVVRQVDDAKAFEIATIENLQRADMNPMDEARAFQRILDDRLAADPTLKLKDAKEIIATATGKTVRFVELRLQLTKLPAIKQVEVEQGKISAKEAIQYARHTLPPELPADRLLLLAEIACACAGKGALKTNKSTRIDGANRDDSRLGALQKLSLVYTTKDWNTGEDSIWIYQRALDTLAEADKRFFNDPHAALTKLQARTLGEAAWNNHAAGGKAFVTPWLNPPFAAHPSEIAARERRAQVEAERKAGDARRQKEREKANRDFGREGQAALARVLQLEDESPGMSDAEFAEAYRATMEANGWKLPLRIVWDDAASRISSHDRGDAMLVDDGGEALRASYGALEAIRRMYAIAVNRVAGFAATAGPPILESDWAQEAAAGNFDEVEDNEAEDQLSDEEADDDDSPEYLRRLAGAGAEPQP